MTTSSVLGNIAGLDSLYVILAVVVLFGGSRIPKLARSLGSAKAEFEKGVRHGDGDRDEGAKGVSQGGSPLGEAAPGSVPDVGP